MSALCFLPRDASAERGYEIACRLSVCLCACDVEVWFSHRLEYFENNFTAKQLKAHALADPNTGDLVQREHPQN